ncbi:MAG TPA: ChaN family lipoprotein [Albitalea sp.]
MDRRRFVCAGAGSLLLAQGLAGCASSPAAAPWERRLHGDTLALLGEVHDNGELHRLRLAALQRAVERGWRPALVMEQFDIDRQADIERARRERPRDPHHLVAQAGPARGWHWPHYLPVVALALRFELPLHAGNLPRAQASRLVRESADTVFGAERARALGLDAPLDTAWQGQHEREIGDSHCGVLPQRLWPGMARAQAARDAVMADVLQRHAAPGAVLLAGNGHVRRDIGVPRWLTRVPPQRLLVVGYVEANDVQEAAQADERYSARVQAPPATRDDPCEALRKRSIS